MKKFYAITSNLPAYPLERFVAGPWAKKKHVRRYLKTTTAIGGTREVVKVVKL